MVLWNYLAKTVCDRELASTPCLSLELRMNLSSRAAAGVFRQLSSMLHSIKPFATPCGTQASRRSQLDRSLLQQLQRSDPRASYTCSSALLAKHEPQHPRHVPRSVAARAPSIKHQWDTESAKQVWLKGSVCCALVARATVQAHTPLHEPEAGVLIEFTWSA